MRTVLLILCICVMCYSGFQLYKIYSGYAQADKTYASASEQYVKPNAHEVKPNQETTPTEPLNVAPIQVDFDALLQENEDVVGWIYCPDTSLNFPIVQGQDNDYYLRRMWNGEYNYSGCIFMDYRCDKKFGDYNSIIYGHNMNNDGMFALLEDYLDQEYFQQHPVIYLLTPEADYQIDVIASVLTDANSELYNFSISRNGFDEFLQNVMAQSELSVDVDLQTVEHTVMLSTCAYEFQDARYLVVGALKPLDRVAE